VVFRLSGTGTVGATIRVYLEQLENDPSRFDLNPSDALSGIIDAAFALSDLKTMTGRDAPDVIT
jgi:phosphoglucomutase